MRTRYLRVELRGVVNEESSCEESWVESRVVKSQEMSRELSCQVVMSCKLLVMSCELSI